jgi:hypothetical protein
LGHLSFGSGGPFGQTWQKSTMGTFLLGEDHRHQWVIVRHAMFDSQRINEFKSKKLELPTNPWKLFIFLAKK